MSISKRSLIYVAGHRGMVGSAVAAALERHGYRNLLARPRAELDLSEQAAVQAFFLEYRPEVVILAAARVGGIAANSSHPAQFIRDNLLIQGNVIEAARRAGAQKLVFLGSSCIYPRLAPQPIREEYLLTGPLEPTNEWYAVAKIAGIKLYQAYRREYGFNAICLMPTNLYGPGLVVRLQGRLGVAHADQNLAQVEVSLGDVRLKPRDVRFPGRRLGDRHPAPRVSPRVRPR